jgi:hypothetical protein
VTDGVTVGVTVGVDARRSWVGACVLAETIGMTPPTGLLAGCLLGLLTSCVVGPGETVPRPATG